MGLIFKAIASTTRNDSSVTGTTVKNALETLDSGLSSETAFESKTFALSANGTSIAGSDAGITLTNPGANPTITIPTTKRLKLINILIYDQGSIVNIGAVNEAYNVFSSLQYNGTLGIMIDWATFGIPTSGQAFIFNNPNGWQYAITTINDISFNITFTQVGAGLAITGQAHLIEQ